MEDITVNFGNIIEEMERKQIEIVFVKDKSIFVKDKEGHLYQIELYRYGSYLDKLIHDKIEVTFNRIDDGIIEDYEIEEVMDIPNIKKFIEKVVNVEYAHENF